MEYLLYGTFSNFTSKIKTSKAISQWQCWNRKRENGEYNAIYIPDMNDSGDSSSDSELDTESDVELSYSNKIKIEDE